MGAETGIMCLTGEDLETSILRYGPVVAGGGGYELYPHKLDVRLLNALIRKIADAGGLRGCLRCGCLLGRSRRTLSACSSVLAWRIIFCARREAPFNIVLKVSSIGLIKKRLGG